MTDLTGGITARQTKILKLLIDEYIEMAEPVGSQVLEKKHDLGVSSATIRNEMVNLTKMGFLKQPHTSAGRVPTPKAMKFYIHQLMEEKQMSLADEVKAKEGVENAKGNLDTLMAEATHALAQYTDSLAISALDDGRTWHAGMSNVFTCPEFADLGLCSGLFSFLEEAGSIEELFFNRFTGASPVEILFGEELGWPRFEPVGILATRFKVRDHQGAMGVIGPTRSKYPKVIPVLRYFGDMVERILK